MDALNSRLQHVQTAVHGTAPMCFTIRIARFGMIRSFPQTRFQRYLVDYLPRQVLNFILLPMPRLTGEIDLTYKPFKSKGLAGFFA
jgi:hypothetical protein